ncbi:uncharacterized protein LOC143919208 [Arctopsyche grandis]|uniref:uncharacterized protein LOC143919208 n=1 Tax=Arctopsyche grandis TaxID=121162 RepID=UPI00406D99B5
MSRLLHILTIFLAVLTITEALSGIGRGGGKSSYNSTGRKTTSTTRAGVRNPILSEPEEAKLNGEKQKSRPGISAWGIIALIISLILLCMGTYYSVLFYPLLCTKERKYDIIDLSPV